MSERDVADAAQVALGEPVSTAKLEDARRRIVDWYKELGYFYVDVKYALEPSADNTRARVRFDVTEGDQVIVRAIVVRGLATHARERRPAAHRARGRASLTERATCARRRSASRRSGVFSSITVGLSDPYVPRPSKTSSSTSSERPRQYVEMQPGLLDG